MSAPDAMRMFIIYSNFVVINKNLLSLQLWVQTDLKFDLELRVYEVEVPLIKHLKTICDSKLRAEKDSNKEEVQSEMNEAEISNS